MNSIETKYKRLVSNVIELAAKDVMERTGHKRDSALAWIKTEGFEWYCHKLEVSPTKIRRGIQKES